MSAIIRLSLGFYRRKKRLHKVQRIILYTEHINHEDKYCCLHTFDLSLWSFYVGQHARHVDTISVQVLQEHIGITSG